MKENSWLPDTEFNPHEAPTVPETVGTEIIATEDGGIGVNVYQDVEPILDHCKELANSGQFRSPSNEMHHVAEFPMVLVEKYMKDRGVTWEEFINNPAHVKAMIADPALGHFLIAKHAVHKAYR